MKIKLKAKLRIRLILFLYTNFSANTNPPLIIHWYYTMNDVSFNIDRLLFVKIMDML